MFFTMLFLLPLFSALDIVGHCIQQIESLAVSALPSQCETDMQETQPFILPHGHDEVLMRLRSRDATIDSHGSHVGVVGGAKRMVRTRASKIQNNVLKVCQNDLRLRVPVELQVLGKKDADTIGFALVQATKPALDALSHGVQRNVNGCVRARVVHIITGDGIATNLAAARRLYYRFRHHLDGPGWVY